MASKNRTDRWASIVQTLATERWQRAEDLAAALDVSMRTIYRDMRALDEAGVPVEAVPGRGYRLFEGYLLPPVALSADEVVMLLLAEGYAARHGGEVDRATARSARSKLEAILPAPLQEELSRLRQRLRAEPVNVFDRPEEQALLPLLRQAAAAAHAVRLRYPAHPSLAAATVVHPYALVHRAGAWYLVGFSRALQQVHPFRLSEVKAPEVLEETFERPPGYRVDQDDAEAPREQVVRVLFDAAAARWVGASPLFSLAETETQPDGRLLTTLLVRRETEVIPWLLGWGRHACVLEPASLRQRLAREAGAMAAQYRSDLTLLS